MSDLPPPTAPSAPADEAPAPATGPMSTAEILAQLPPDQAAALAPAVGVDLGQVQRAAEAAGPSPLIDGEDPLTVRTQPVAPKLLRVDDQVYRCRAKLPGKTLRSALEAIQGIKVQTDEAATALQDDTVTAVSLESFDVLEDVMRKAMLPDDFARFYGRYDGSDLSHYTCVLDEATGEWSITKTEGAPELEAIDNTEFALYGMRLVTAYSDNRPTAGRAPSGA